MVIFDGNQEKIKIALIENDVFDITILYYSHKMCSMAHKILIMILFASSNLAKTIDDIFSESYMAVWSSDFKCNGLF